MIEKMVNTSKSDWSNKLYDTLCVYQKTFKIHLGLSVFQSVYDKSCHLAVESENKVYSTVKFLNIYAESARMKRVMQLHDLEDISINTYENALIYKQRTKKYHDN